MKPTERPAKTPHTATALFALLGTLLRVKGSGASGRRFNPATILAAIGATLLAGAGLVAAVPATAGAYAALEGPPIFSAAPGLPDGRVYEQVSPTEKSGNEAGATTTSFDAGALNHYGLAAPDGNSVLFEGTGPMGESPWAASLWFVASKNKGGAAGWSTRALLPRAQQSLASLGGILGAKGFEYIDPSADLSHALVEPNDRFTLAPQTSCPSQIDLTGPDPFVAATWLERPSPATENPVENCAQYGGAPVGGTPDFSTVYFTYSGTLLPEDASRAPHAGGIVNPKSGTLEDLEAWGFYEDREGALREAGVLPDGALDPFGAVPAASGHGKSRTGNEVSADGRRAFFVSPDPASCEPSGHNDCVLDPPELYVRENGERTQLVSRDTLLPEAGGLPAAAPGGALQMPNRTHQTNRQPALDGSYVFASSDGAQAFFQSRNALTQPAEEASPGSEPKMYDFDVDTGALTYLPNVSGEILAVDSDGSALAFMRPEAGGALPEVDLWSAGPGGGSVTQVTQLPSPSGVTDAQMSNDGSALAFQTAATITGFNNRGIHFNPNQEYGAGSEEIYRYDVPTGTLGCVSCAPAGVTPQGDASMSILVASEVGLSELYEGLHPSLEERAISADGERIFFESRDPLVPQDTNRDAPEVKCIETATCVQGNDVYEWENGTVYLISSGKSPRDTYLLGSSENGDDVFFATAQGLVSGDTDGGYDIYDARVPHPGDNPPAAAVPCEGSVCQGPPNVPSPLTPPASATFSGLGNPPSEPAVASAPAKVVAKKTVKCRKNQVKRHGRCVKRPKAKKSTKGRK